MEKTVKCPDCKVELEKIVPDDDENYFKCPKCGYELTKAEMEEKGACLKREEERQLS